jgi:two-component system NtrC family sensor kinase
VQSLLSFSRRHQPERKLVCVNGVVEAVVEILAYQMRTSNIEVVTQLDPKLPQAMVDQHQIQQVVLNIVNNARQAIEAHRPKGCVRINTGVAGANVRLTIQDDGPGIREENLSKVFDPFFTTKEIGKGTGLGLSLCYGIVKEHGGTIQIRSKYGEGATFLIELPIATDTDHKSKPTPGTPPAEMKKRLSGNGRKVLVIDDEEPILQMVREVLSRSGYEVDVASDGESALKRLSDRRYDLAICDWKMPGLNGQQVYERICASDSAMSERLIFMTGDVINDRIQEFLKQKKKFCLTKPFSLTEFEEAIQQALPRN